MKNLIFTIFLILNTSSLLASNPGLSAVDCVSAKTTYSDKSNLKFKNRCNHKIFIAWCGELKNSSKTCGDGKNNTFYTHSRNLGPLETYRTELKPHGFYTFAACRGSKNFEGKGLVHGSNDKGAYTCTKTGSFANYDIDENIHQQKSYSVKGKWHIAVQQPNGKWHGQIVVLKNNGIAFYVYADEKYYFSRWQQKNDKIKVYIFKNKEQYKTNTPYFTLVMNEKSQQFTGQIIMYKSGKTFKAKGHKK